MKNDIIKYWSRNASFNSSLTQWRKLITLPYAMVSSLLVLSFLPSKLKLHRIWYHLLV